MSDLLLLPLLFLVAGALSVWFGRSRESGVPAPSVPRRPEWRFRSRVGHCDAGDGIHGYGDEATAVVNCRATTDRHKRAFVATRLDRCLDLHLQYGGEQDCNWACLGAGDCAEACPEHAIRMEDGLPRITSNLCTGCGDCIPACPRTVLSLIPAAAQVAVACSSNEPVARRASRCSAGCRSGMDCVETRHVAPGLVRAEGERRVLDYTRSANLVPLLGVCPAGVFHDRIAHRPWFTVNDNCSGCGDCLPACPVARCIVQEGPAGSRGRRARIDSALCVGCGLCVPVCPDQAIQVVGALGYDREP